MITATGKEHSKARVARKTVGSIPSPVCPEATLVQLPVSKPTVALVLNGGAARAVTCLGVLDVLARLVSPSYVIGKSAGALIGLMLALGYSPQEMVSLLKKELSPRLLRLLPGGS